MIQSILMSAQAVLFKRAEYQWKAENNETSGRSRKKQFFLKMDDTLHSDSSYEFLLE